MGRPSCCRGLSRHTPESDSTARGRQEGQSLVEFVIMLPLLLIVLGGLLDLGRLYYAHVAVTDVAGEGVGYAAAFLPGSGGRCPDAGTTTCPYDPTNPDPDGDDRRHLGCTCERAYAATSRLIEGDDLIVTVDVPGGTGFGSEITVTVRYSHTLLTPFVNAIVPGGTVPLTAYATERVVDPSTE